MKFSIIAFLALLFVGFTSDLSRADFISSYVFCDRGNSLESATASLNLKLDSYYLEIKLPDSRSFYLQKPFQVSAPSVIVTQTETHDPEVKVCVTVTGNRRD